VVRVLKKGVEMTWDFYLVVGGSLVLAFVVVFLSKREQKAQAVKETE